MSQPVTQVTITIDQHTLQTLKMALAALQLNAQVIGANLDAQVQQQLLDAQPKDPPQP